MFSVPVLIWCFKTGRVSAHRAVYSYARSARPQLCLCCGSEDGCNCNCAAAAAAVAAAAAAAAKVAELRASVVSGRVAALRTRVAVRLWGGEGQSHASSIDAIFGQDCHGDDKLEPSAIAAAIKATIAAMVGTGRSHAFPPTVRLINLFIIVK